MSCLSCRSSNEAELAAELLIHFSGLKNLDKPAFWLFPKILVCLDCGCAHFAVPEGELASLSSTLESSAGHVPVSGGSASRNGS